MTLIGGTLILLACIGLFFMIWAGIAAILFPWADRMRARSLDDTLNGKAGNDDRAQR